MGEYDTYVQITSIEITTSDDHNECETCGSNYDSGGAVMINGEQVFEYVPLAACWDNRNLGAYELLVIALRTLGIKVHENGTIPYNCETDDELDASQK